MSLLFNAVKASEGLEYYHTLRHNPQDIHHISFYSIYNSHLLSKRNHTHQDAILVTEIKIYCRQLSILFQRL